MKSSNFHHIYSAVSVSPSRISTMQFSGQYALAMQGEIAAMRGGTERMLDKLVETMNKHGSHRVSADTRMIWDRDVMRVTVACLHCPAHWSMERSGPAMGVFESNRDWLVYDLVPFLGDIMREECGAAVKRALLAEYVTERLAEAGPAGVAVSDLIRELVADLDAPGGDVAQMIRELRMEPWIRYEAVCPPITMTAVTEVTADTPLLMETRTVDVLRLPQGHPMRDW